MSSNENHLIDPRSYNDEDTRANILVVDDDKDIAGYLSAVLTLEGHRTSEAYTPQDAIKLLETQPHPDLVLTDLVMPGIGGLGLITYIKQGSHLPYIPVILITAYHGTIDRAAALQCGADDFLTKPVNRAELQARVKSLLRVKKALDTLNRKLEETNVIIEGADKRYLDLKKENALLAQRVTLQHRQRELAARISSAIWHELEAPLTSAINLSQNGLRDGSLSLPRLQLLVDELKKALEVTTKLEQLATEARKGTGSLGRE
jgi:DNA-binding response OmpR family regulator